MFFLHSNASAYCENFAATAMAAATALTNALDTMAYA